MENIESKKFCVCIDGSDYSDYAFELTMNEFYQSNDYIVVCHITNKSKEDLPFESQPKTLYSKYSTKLLTKITSEHYNIEFKERSSDKVHSLSDMVSIANKHSCNLALVGYYGHKANKTTKELTKGIQYLISSVDLPVMIIKEYKKRSEKKEEGYNWLFPLSKASGKSWNAFKYALSLVGPKDKIKGMIVHQSKDLAKEVETAFETEASEHGITNYSFQVIELDKKLGVAKQIIEMVNFGDEYFDFLVCGHDPSKYSIADDAPLIQIIKQCQANILFKK